MLVPHRGWWAALWNLIPRKTDVYIDVATEASWDGGIVSLVDLDLDVIRAVDGTVRLDDEDEFVDHATAMAYPPRVVDRARTAAAELVVMVEGRREPFGSVGETWRDRGTRAGAWVEGTVVSGHGVASGQAGDHRFPGGTISLQTPAFADRGLDLTAFHPATINVEIAGRWLRPVAPLHTFDDVTWLDGYPPETFSFFSARIRHGSTEHDALVYRPHPETKPEHHQDSAVVELLAPPIEGFAEGDVVDVWIDPLQATFELPHSSSSSG